ncbi:MAG: CRISPR-associated protein Csx11 [Candidatus Methanofastidiosia archaeon]
MSKSMETLGKNRDSLLLAEVGCWLHMMGKFHEDFLGGNYNLDTEIVRNLEKESKYENLAALLRGGTEKPTWTARIWKKTGLHVDDNTSFATLIEKHKLRDGSLDNLEKLSSDAHGKSSWVEKGLLNRFFPSQQNKIYPSTVFGFRMCCIDLHTIKKQRDEFYDNLEEYLKELKKTNADPLTGWLKFRTDFVAMLTRYFSQTVGDTRLPINDVTLFDQTVAAVALFKASLAQVLLTGYTDPIKTKYRWRFLRIGINGPAFWNRSLKIADILARQELINAALDTIRILIEVEYPLGYEIYRDEFGSVFVLPDMEDILEYVVPSGKLHFIDDEVMMDETLGELIKRIFQGFSDDEVAICLSSSQGTRNMLLFGEEVSSDVSETSKYSEKTQIAWAGARDQELCVICGLRPQGFEKKLRTRKTCKICEERRSDRSHEWMENLAHTIWIDEVSDINGRVALVVGKFGLKEWLGGELLNSLVAFNPETRNVTDMGKQIDKINFLQYRFDYSQLVSEISRALLQKEFLGKKTRLLDNLILGDSRNELGKFSDIYQFYIGDSDLCCPSADKEWYFALFMLRKQPSPPRIRRVWETTRNFWLDMLPIEHSITQSEISKTVGKKGPRLLIKGEIKPHPNEMGPYHAYELVVKETKMSVMWDEERQGFITIDNLEYIAGSLGIQDVKHEIKGELKIEESTGYGARDKQLGTILVEKVQEVGDKYIPAIPLLAEPSTFMALVPADKAFDMVRIIKQKYGREMGKVRNRLPITLGIIFSHKYTPLRVIIDAGQRMLTGMQSEQPSQYFWNVFKEPSAPQNTPFNDQSFTKATQIFIERQGRILKWDVPLRMGDGTTDDHWYPYVFLEGDPGPRNRSLKTVFPWTGGLKWLVHAEDIRKGDIIHFTPSLFDFQWLDTGSRRFEIAYENGKRLGEKGIGRPYLLESVDTLERIWDSLQKGLENSQIHALRDIVEQKRKEWNPTEEDCSRYGTFWRFCRDVIATSHWITVPWKVEDKKECLDTWADHAAHGWLSDSIEIYMQIMKKRSQAGGAKHV